MNRGRTALAVVLMVLVGTVATTAPAHAAGVAGPAGFESWEELFAMQQRLIVAADAISAKVGPADGLASISAKPERRELWIYWKGDVPAAIGEVIEAQRASVPVRVIPARFSRTELLAVAATVAEQDGVTAVGPLGDGSGLTVSTASSMSALLSLPAVRDAGMPLVAKERRPMLANRHDSVAPHRGGATFTFAVPGGTAMCTTGFAISQGGGRVKRMLTAGHCGANGDTVNNGTGQLMGTVTGDNNTKDTMLISTSSSGRIYVDGHSSSTSKPVYTALGSYVDTLVCTSGSMTGEHCKIRITAVNLTINVGYLITPVVEAVHDDSLVAAGTGDSGGPVVAQDSPGVLGHGDFVLVYAMGTITAIDLDGELPCGSSWQPSTCSDTMYYVDIMDSLAHYNATIVTG
jgi:hypothetical protein